MCENCLQNPFAILQHLVVPEPEDFPPLAFQIGVSGLVARAFGVLRPVGFDDQLSANAEKVDNVGAHWNLSAKLESAEATVAQKTPQTQFGVSRRSTHRSGARALVRRDVEIGLHRSSIGPAALIRRASGAPPSPRGRRGPAAPFGASLLRDERRRSAPLLPGGEGGRRSRSDEGALVTSS
jgi:hypothetical protein